MQGDPKVDELMNPVLAAIKRHVKDRDAVTDIYNRAYEAIMNSMDVKEGKTYCAYCGAEYPLDDNAATQVSEHIKICKKHPMRASEAEVARLTARAEVAEARLSDVEAVLKGCGFKIVKDRYRGGRLILVSHSCEYIPTQDVFPKGGEE